MAIRLDILVIDVLRRFEFKITSRAIESMLTPAGSAFVQTEATVAGVRIAPNALAIGTGV